MIEHAYRHRTEFRKKISTSSSPDYKVDYSQFYINLAIGLELILKSEFLRHRIDIKEKNKWRKSYTKSFRKIIDDLDKILNVDQEDLEEIKQTLHLIRIRRDNIAHLSHKRYGGYADEHRISCVVLILYQKLGGKKKEIIEMLEERIEKSKVISGMDYKPLKVCGNIVTAPTKPRI